MTRTFQEASAITADDNEYDTEYGDNETTHDADYDNDMIGYFSCHCNDNINHILFTTSQRIRQSLTLDKMCSRSALEQRRLPTIEAVEKG